MILRSTIVLVFAMLQTQNSNNTQDFIVTVLISAAVVIIMIGFVRYRQRHKRRGTNEAGSQYRKPQRIRQDLPLPGAQFEAQVYDALVKHDSSARLIMNALFARPEAINCFFEIDILIISHKGIHVLELKDWHSFVSGELKDKAWMVGKLESGFLHYPKEVYSPHKQNEKHIEDLNALYPFAYKGHVIFSKWSQIGDGTKGVSHLEPFLNHYDQLAVELDSHEIKTHYDALMRLHQPERIDDHRARLRANASRFK